MAYVLKIAKMHDSFYCRETGLHLYFYNPVGEVNRISGAIQLALNSGKILNVTPKAPVKEEVKIDHSQIADTGDTIVSGELFTKDEPGISLESLTKKELISFIEENELDVKFDSKTSATKLRELIEAALVKEAK